MRSLFAVCLLALAACSSSSTPSCGPASDVVTNVVDGDTIELQGGEKVRYILADATEITKGHDECYGTEARDFNVSMVLGKTVQLTYDQVCRDVYGRLLAYVSVDGFEVNSLLVERGFACVLHISPDGDARLQEFLDLQAAAEDAKRGVWGACDPVPCAQ
jgi:micrococcal nuclease